MKEAYTLESLFVHPKLTMQILDPTNRNILDQNLRDANSYPGHLKEVYINTILTSSITSYLHRSKIVSLEELLLKGEKLRKGELVWFHNSFYFKGMSNAKYSFISGKRPAYAEFHIKLDRYNLTVSGKFNFEHTYGDSSLVRLSGKKTKFIFGFIDDLLNDEIIIRPILIGDKILTNEIQEQLNSFSLKLNIEDIDEFKEAAFIPYNTKSLDINLNRNIPEINIKTWFAEILNEGNIQKDWGGETSDLFSNHIHINGKRRNAAFVLKGPSKFHQMSIKDLGSNGNQIVRLFDEPADVLIVQHCHYIKQEIYKTMEAFASRFDNIRQYCVIDGIDTLRILKAYNKV